jgi:tetratricopeptide (TPR) repeat protein
MASITRLTFFTIALSLMLSLFCLPPARTTFASLTLHWDARQDDHSPAYKEGMVALGAANYEKAAGHFKQAAADKPDDMWALYYLGLCLLRLNWFGEAANAYQQALAIKPNEAAVHYQLCKIYLEMGASDAAEKERRWLQENDQALAMYLSDPPIRVLRGLPDGLTHKAIEASRKIRFNPATRNGEPVSVRGQLEFTFNLY